MTSQIDIELLERAAKAAGLLTKRDKSGLWIVEEDGSPVRRWNPLKSNDDAFTLAVQLGISITPYPIYNENERHSVIAKQRRRSDTRRERNPTEAMELYEDDPCAATRRAIVRAAAAIVEIQ